ncbi:amino acid adenylation domain-containing protein [Actinoplanes sp. NPDC049599]|uniref:amino acid adenylation domain-containing protein n=1 Tax=Actinoplanes sp. NPDC049599 TaxID=3363903 RepID=UPI0037A3B051
MTNRTSLDASAAPHDGAPAVVSRVQEGLWFLSRLWPADVPLTVAASYRLEGPINRMLLREAWEAVLRRHDVLRSTLRDVGGRPEPRIEPGPHADGFRFVDLPDTRGPAVEHAAAVTEPLDLAHGPVARLTLIAVAEYEHLLVLVAHRAVADEDSLSVAIDQLCRAYAHGEQPTGTRQYTDHARLERAAERGPGEHRLARWWATNLRATVHPPTRRVTRPARTLRVEWGAPLGDELRMLARAEGTRPLSVVLAGLHVLLARHHGRYGTTVALPVSLRGPGDQDVIGPFTTVQPIAADLADDPRFDELLRRLTATVRDAAVRRRMPFPRLVRAVNPPRPPSGLPLGEVLLADGKAPDTPRTPGLRWHHEDARTGSPVAGLSLHIDATGAEVTYAPQFLGAAEAEGLLEQLGTLLSAAVRGPGTRIGDLPLEPPATQPGTVADPGGDDTVIDLIGAQAARQPAAVAVDGDEPLTYGRLWDRSGALAARLPGAGLSRGAAVAVYLAHGPRQVTASLAVLRAGGSVSWLAPGDAEERARLVIDDLRPPLLLVDGADPAAAALAGWYREQGYGKVLAITDADDADDAGPVPPPVDPDSPAYAAYTSGSSGRPKGIAQTHRALAQFATWLATALRLGPAARLALWVAVEHDPSICETFATLVAGGTLCPVPDRVRKHPERFAAWLAQEQITALQTVPTFARELVRSLAEQGTATGLQVLVLMGEALPGHLAAAAAATLPATRLLNLYGPTETIAATWHELEATEPGEVVPIGRAIPGRSVLVLDPHDRPCPRGVVGELVIRSPYAIRGYLGHAAGPRPAFRPVAGLAAEPPAYRTGDLARRTFTGHLEYAGRRDHQVKLAGSRLELTAVEAALTELPSVADCAVLPVTGPGGLVDRLIAYVVAAGTADPGGWRAHLRRRFGPALLRLTFAAIEVVPRNVAGKVDRARLPVPGVADDPGHRPLTEPQRRMAALWAGAGVDSHGENTDFFAAGGDSAALLRVAAAAGTDVRDLLDHPTVAGMAAVVENADAEQKWDAQHDHHE